MSLLEVRAPGKIGFKVVAPGGTLFLFVMKFLFRLITSFLLALDLIEAFAQAYFAQVKSEEALRGLWDFDGACVLIFTILQHERSRVAVIIRHFLDCRFGYLARFLII